MWRPNLLIAVCIFAPLFGCGTSGTPVEPEATSYPRESIKKPKITVGIGLPTSGSAHMALSNPKMSEPLYQLKVERADDVDYQFEGFEGGDTSEREEWVAPYFGGSIDDRGRAACDGPYRTSAINYYAGDEATLRFMRISGPALKVIFRCPVYTGASGQKHVNMLREFSAKLPDQEYFDTMHKSYSVRSTELVDSIRKVSIDNGIDIEDEANREGVFLIRSTPMVSASRIRSFSALVADDGQKASVLFIAPVYKSIGHDNPFFHGVAPADRETAYNEAKLFLGMIESKISTKK